MCGCACEPVFVCEREREGIWGWGWGGKVEEPQTLSVSSHQGANVISARWAAVVERKQFLSGTVQRQVIKSSTPVFST